MGNIVLILGGSSDLGKALAYKYASQGSDLYIAGRNKDDLEKTASLIREKYNIMISVFHFDSSDYASHNEFYNQFDPKPFGVIYVIGYMGEQESMESSFEEVQKIFSSNYLGAVSMFLIIANHFSSRKNGFIIGVSSVAGNRARKKNYIYGSAKAGFTAFLSGLRNRLFESGVQVLTVIPGFMNTKMTKDMVLPKFLTASPKDVANKIYMAQIKNKNIIYEKSIWRLIMFIVELIPESIFKKLNL